MLRAAHAHAPADPLHGAVRVIVMNNAPPGQLHEEFERLREQAQEDTGGEGGCAAWP